MIKAGKQANEKNRWIEYNNYIQSQGFDIIHIIGDGNCLFRAISHQLQNTEAYHAEYRSIAMNYILAHQERFSNFLLDDSPYHGRLDLYVQKMSKNGEWGGHFEMLAISEALNVQICVFQVTLDLLTIGSQNQQKIYLAYNRSSRHYNSLIRNQITDQIPLQRTIKKVIGKKPIMEVKTDHSKKKVIKKKKREQDEDFNCQESQKISGKIGVKKKVFKSKSKVNQDDKMIPEQEINFQEIFTLNDEDLIYWALNAKLLKKPSFCKICRNTTGKKVIMKLIANKNYLDKFIWRCNNKDCGAIENIRNRNNLFGEFPRVKLRILLIFIFTHFTVMLSLLH